MQTKTNFGVQVLSEPVASAVRTGPSSQNSNMKWAAVTKMQHCITPE